jgi:D-aminopeptidase
MKLLFSIALTQLCMMANAQERKPAEAYGIKIGVMQKGATNSITDVPGVKVGQVTLVIGDSIRTGVTAILPHGDNLFQQKVPGAVYTGNGFGKLAGVTQIKELGTIESPIVLTNTMNVAEGINGVIRYTITQKGNENVQSVNAVVGETNDGELNDIRGKHVTVDNVLTAINTATTQKPQQGNVGAGTGTVCFGFKGGIGTASRKLPAILGGYTVGVLVQTNFGGVLQIDGVPVGEALNRYAFYEELSKKADGSCMMVVATDAPLDSRNLERLAKRAFMGLAKTGGIASNGSGDYVIAFSSNASVRVAHNSNAATVTTTVLKNDAMSPLFMAAIEATEEAIINSLFMAEDMKGKNGKMIEALPMDKVIPLLKKYNRIGG